MKFTLFFFFDKKKGGGISILSFFTRYFCFFGYIISKLWIDTNTSERKKMNWQDSKRSIQILRGISTLFCWFESPGFSKTDWFGFWNWVCFSFFETASLNKMFFLEVLFHKFPQMSENQRWSLNKLIKKSPLQNKNFSEKRGKSIDNRKYITHIKKHFIQTFLPKTRTLLFKNAHEINPIFQRYIFIFLHRNSFFSLFFDE